MHRYFGLFATPMRPCLPRERSSICEEAVPARRPARSSSGKGPTAVSTNPCSSAPVEQLYLESGLRALHDPRPRWIWRARAREALEEVRLGKNQRAPTSRFHTRAGAARIKRCIDLVETNANHRLTQKNETTASRVRQAASKVRDCQDRAQENASASQAPRASSASTISPHPGQRQRSCNVVYG